MLKWLSEAIIDTRKHETMLFVFSEAQGVGKGLIFEHLVSGLVGENYAKGAKISEVEKGHNGFVEDSVYVHIDEIGAFSMDSKELGEQLKQMSNKNVVMCDKYMKQRRTRQYCNYVFNSNNVTGIPIKSGDRRFSCFEARFTDFTDTEYYNKLSDICDISDTRNPGFASAFLEMLVDIRSGLDGKFTRGEYEAVNLHKPLKNAARDRVISCNDIYNTFAAEFKTTSIHSDKPDLDYGYIVDEFIKFATSRGCSAIQKIQDYKLIKDIMTAIPLRDEILGWTGLIKVRTDVRVNDTRIVFHKIGLESVFPKKRSSE